MSHDPPDLAPFGMTYAGPEPPRPHSKLGIASLVLSAFAGLTIIGLIAYVAVAEARSPGSTDGEATEIALGLVGIGGVLVALVGLVLGIVGLCLPDRRRVTALLGTIFCGLIVLGMCGLVGVGMAIG